jgi:hypothetical protein
MRRVARPLSCAACKRDDGVKRADGYGRTLRLTIAFRSFESGEYRGTAWPKLLEFWGLPNLQVINRDAHAAKSAFEAQARSAARPLETELT